MPDNHCEPERHDAHGYKINQQFEFRNFPGCTRCKHSALVANGNLHLCQMEFFEIRFYKKTKPTRYNNVLAKLGESAHAQVHGSASEFMGTQFCSNELNFEDLRESANPRILLRFSLPRKQKNASPNFTNEIRPSTMAPQHDAVLENLKVSVGLLRLRLPKLLCCMT